MAYGSGADHRQNASEVREANKRKKELQRARQKAEKERKAYNKELRKRKAKGKSTEDLERPGTTKAPDGTTTIPLSNAKKYEPTAEELKAKAKAEGEDIGMLGHQPVYDEAVLWMAKSYIERENWTGADFHFRKLEADNEVPPRVYEELPVARAYYHMKRENYPQVIPFLEQGIERAKRRDDKARYAYIIAQLYDMQGKSDKAAEFYQQSLAYSNKYDMEFNTQLSIIRSSVKNKTMSPGDATQALNKMLKDDKNKEYLGRIYFTLATLSLDAQDIPGAIVHLENSVANVGGDKFQEIESQYLLATLYLQQLNYVEAEDAFKATTTIMDEKDPRYKYVKKMGDNLRDIAVNLETISLQDSLLRLSYKTDDELKLLAKAIKKQRQAEAEAAAEKSKYTAGAVKKTPSPSGASGAISGAPVRQVGGSVVETTFWAFDQKELKKTRREFDRTWDDIPLTDYWRVSSKADQFLANADATTGDAGDELGVYESEIEDFFKDVPKDDSARAISHTTIRKSMYLLGQLYRDRIEDYESSVKVLEDLLVKYPEAPERLEVYYQIYLSALSGGDHARAEKYKNMIIAEYPNSRFAKVLGDPNFAANQQSEQARLNAYYDETFLYFQADSHEIVLDRVTHVGDKFGVNNALMAKFDMLRALSIGAQVGKEAYVDALKHVVARYPNSEEEKKARDMLLLLGDSQASKTYGETGLNQANFAMEENALHFVVVYVNNQDAISVQDTKVAVAKFNSKYFQLDNLKLSNLVFDPAKNHSLILVRSFTTKEKAMKYFETAKRNPKDFLPANAVFEVYPITQKNYREVIKARTLTTYKEFFEANY